MNETIRVAFGLIGGLALFLFGMNMMSDSLQKVAGEKMKKVLAMLTRNPLLGVISGALVTAVLQSSSATTVMAIGFVSAGLISLPQAISVIFGANIGTTMTAQIIAFNISDYIYPIIFIGFIIQFVAKSEKLKYIGQAVLAFGLLFLGIETMGNVMKPLADSPFFVNLIAQVSDVPILGVLVGMCMTLVVQSSSATIAVLQNFASQPGPDGVSSVLGLAGAIPVLLGDNIGTTITAILASIGQSRDAKRTALAHCLFNVSGTCLFIWFIKPYARLIQYISPHGDEIAVISRQIANAHTCFNLTMTLIWLPLLWLMVKIVMKILPERDYERKPITTLDDNLLHQPVSALHLVFEEIIACSDRVNDMLVSLRGIRLKTLKDTLQVVHSEAQEIAVQGDAISEYLAKMFSKGVGPITNSVGTRTIYSIADFIESPGLLIDLLANTINVRGDGIIGEVVGKNLSQKWMIIYAFIFLAWLGAMRLHGESPRFNLPARIIALLMSLGSIALIFVSMLIGFTSVDKTYIDGIQGRYLIPIIPVLFLITENGIVRRREGDDTGILYGAGFLLVITFGEILMFYLGSR